jgi:hypothetical protein
MKKLLIYFSLASVLFLSSCEKDIYESPIQQSHQAKPKGTSHYVSIDEVPFLKPQIKKFSNNIESRGIDSLDLDTEHIVEFLQSNGFKSYSILVKKDSTELEETYFENLHIVKDAEGNLYDSFLVKYKPESDGKLDFNNYTGALEFYNEDKILTGTIHIEHSLFKLLEPAPPTGGEETGGGGGGEDPECPCNSGGPSMMSQFFDWLGGVIGSIGNSIGNFFTNLGNLEEGSNSSGPGGYVEIVLTGPGGTIPNGPSGSTAGPGVVFVPNIPTLTGLQKANEIYEWLSISDLTVRTWLRQNLVQTDEIFSTNFDEYNNPFGNKNFVIEAINALKQGGEVDFPRNIIYAFNMPCQKQIVKDIIDNCSPFTNLIYQTFNTDDRANIKFTIGSNLDDAPAATSSTYSGGSEKPVITIRFDTDYLNTATNLSIVAATLHELVHAYLMSLYIKGTLVATNSEYETLLNAYILFYANQSQETFDPLDEAMHDAMEDFINPMANSIYNYALSKNISGANPDFCLKLAWGGMHGYNLFTQSLTLEQQQQQQYETVTAIEQENASGAKGTPCN